MKKSPRYLRIVPLTLLALFIIASVKANAEPITVSIDIKPWSCPNSINPRSKGVVPVAVKTTPTFDASTIDHATVVFAGASPLRWAMEDVDSDGDMDVIYHFKTQELALISTGWQELTLTGYTTGGMEISGSGIVRLVPFKL